MPPTALAVVGGIYIFNYLTALCFSAYSIVMSKNIANFAISNPAMRGASEEGQHRALGGPLHTEGVSNALSLTYRNLTVSISKSSAKQPKTLIGMQYHTVSFMPKGVRL